MFEHPMFHKNCCQASVHQYMFTRLLSAIWYRSGKIKRRFQLFYTSHVKFVKGQVFLHVNPPTSEHFMLRNYFLTHKTIANSVRYLIVGFWVPNKSSRNSATGNSATVEIALQQITRRDRRQVILITGFQKKSPYLENRSCDCE